MAYSYVRYTGDAIIQNWAIPFGYLSKDHIEVRFDGVLKAVTTDYTFLNATTIRTNVAQAVGVKIEIRRNTPKTTAFVDFNDGSTLEETNLDNNALQALYLAQESLDQSADAILEDSTGVFDAESKRIKNVAAPNEANDAARKAYVDAIATNAGNVPTPGNPADDNKVIRATAGTFGWYSFLKDWISDATAFAKTWLGLADAAAARTNLSVYSQAETDARPFVEEALIDAKGDLIVGTADNTPGRVAAGADGTVPVYRAGAAAGIEPAKIGTAQQFDGLLAGTHPDHDKRLTQVAVRALRRAIMSDGTRYDDIVVPGTDAMLTADITVAGASGLDTGSEQASTWYSYRLIGKSSTKAKADLRLILHREKDWFKDEDHVTTSASRALRPTTTPNEALAQGFIVDTTGKLPFVDVGLARAGSPPSNVWVEIHGDSGGFPNGVAVAVSDKLEAIQVTAAISRVRFIFRTPPTLTSGTQYHLVLRGDFAKSDANRLAWAGVNADNYRNGTVACRASETNVAALTSGWGAASGILDFDFTAYIERNNAALTFPTGYDQECLLGYVFNNSGSNFIECIALDKKTRLLGAESTFVVSTTPLIIDLSPYVPPVPAFRMTMGVIENGTSSSNAVLSPISELKDLVSLSVAVCLQQGVSILYLPAASTYGVIGSQLTEVQAIYAKCASACTLYAQEYEW